MNPSQHYSSLLSQEAFDLLALETFKINRHHCGKGLDPFSESEMVEMSELMLSYPISAGVIYYIQQTQHLFIIKMKAVPNIEEAFAQLDDELGSQLSTFSADELQLYREHREELQFYECPYLDLAEVVADQLGNRRYGQDDGGLGAMSNMGLYWYGKMDLNQLEVIFNGTRAMSEGVVLLGPLADPNVSKRRFDELLALLLESRLIDSFECSTKRFVLHFVAGPVGEVVRHGLKQLLFEGVWDEPFLKLLGVKHYRTLHIYLQELVLIRQLWRSIQQQLTLAA